MTFGDRLRAEREKRAVSLDEIAASTRIRRCYLEALEQNAFGELPGEVFSKGYVRAYAAHLGADPEALLRAYSRELRVRASSESVEPGDPLDQLRRAIDRAYAPRSSSHRQGVIAGGLLLAALAGGGATWWMTRSPGDSRRAEPRPVERTAVQPPEQVPVESTTTPPATPLPVERTVVPRPAPSTPTPAETGAAPPEEPSRSLPTPTPAVPIVQAPPRVLAVEVAASGVGTAVVHRELRGRTDRIVVGDDAWFWTLVVGGKRGDRIRHLWIHEGREVGVAELPVGGPHWRTFSRQALPPGSAGRWAVEARDASGAVLARAEFLCTETP